jgi:hypothetical protein
MFSAWKDGFHITFSNGWTFSVAVEPGGLMAETACWFGNGPTVIISRCGSPEDVVDQMTEVSLRKRQVPNG